jgi:hypothetical protein
MPCAGEPVDKQIEALLNYLEGHELYSGKTVCILSSRKNRRQRREMVEEHDGTSFETRKFLCIITSERLPKQHFKL